MWSPDGGTPRMRMRRTLRRRRVCCRSHVDCYVIEATEMLENCNAAAASVHRRRTSCRRSPTCPAVTSSTCRRTCSSTTSCLYSICSTTLCERNRSTTTTSTSLAGSTTSPGDMTIKQYRYCTQNTLRMHMKNCLTTEGHSRIYLRQRSPDR